jgi:tetratricopeptide (TPR) repeat protein
MKVINIILLGLTLFLTSSPFFLSNYFADKILLGQTRYFSTDLRTQKLVLSVYRQHKKDHLVGSNSWLIASRAIAKVEGAVAFELGQYYQEQQQEVIAVRWYKQAIKLNFTAAKLVLAKILLRKNEALAALNLVKNDNDIQSMLTAVRAALIVGNTDYIEAIYPQLILHEKGRELQRQLIKFNVFNSLDSNNLYLSSKAMSTVVGLKYFMASNIRKDNSCLFLIEPYATNLADLLTFEKLIAEYVNTQNDLPFCFTQVSYVAEKKLACSHDDNEAIRCNASYWGGKSKKKALQVLATRYLAVLLPEGGANVNLGIMYLDRHDNLDVFSHELAHLLGFIDEYPLPKSHQRCDDNQDEQFAYNISVLMPQYQGTQKELRKSILKQLSWAKFILPTTPILTRPVLASGAKSWQLGTPEKYSAQVGVFPAKTCFNQKTTAFKALKRVTQLEYFSAPFPDVYLHMFQKSAKDFLMPSYHYNVAQSYFKQGNYQLAKRWLQKSAKLEQDPVRIKKILTGSF